MYGKQSGLHQWFPAGKNVSDSWRLAVLRKDVGEKFHFQRRRLISWWWKNYSSHVLIITVSVK